MPGRCCDLLAFIRVIVRCLGLLLGPYEFCGGGTLGSVLGVFLGVPSLWELAHVALFEKPADAQSSAAEY